jgi:hypothetical protein
VKVSKPALRATVWRSPTISSKIASIVSRSSSRRAAVARQARSRRPRSVDSANTAIWGIVRVSPSNSTVIAPMIVWWSWLSVLEAGLDRDVLVAEQLDVRLRVAVQHLEAPAGHAQALRGLDLLAVHLERDGLHLRRDLLDVRAVRPRRPSSAVSQVMLM